MKEISKWVWNFFLMLEHFKILLSNCHGSTDSSQHSYRTSGFGVHIAVSRLNGRLLVMIYVFLIHNGRLFSKENKYFDPWKRELAIPNSVLKISKFKSEVFVSDENKIEPFIVSFAFHYVFNVFQLFSILMNSTAF